jgi:hypothetical protein
VSRFWPRHGGGGRAARPGRQASNCPFPHIPINIDRLYKEINLKVAYVAAILALFTQASLAQVSVVPNTGIPPKHTKLDPELAKQSKPPSRNWLRDADDDSERFRRIELWAAAGDQEMHETAARMRELHAAIQRESWEMAIFQLEKIRGRMIVAMTKRPVRTQNMEALFFDSGVYKDLHDSLTSKDWQRARTEFMRTRAACMACHAAEKIPFINESAVFRDVAEFPAIGRK